MSDNTPPPTVQQLLAELNEVDDWYTLGAVLGVRVRKLREIQTSNSQGGVQQWKIDMFQCWLDSTPTASWEDVIRALEQLDHVTLAARLREGYMRQQPSPAATGSSSDSGMKIEASVYVVKRLQDLERCFSSMLTSFRRVYTNCDLAEMQFFLNDLLETEEFRRCASFDAILRQLRRGHVDTFNIHCLEQLAAHFQRDEVDKLIDEYSEKKEAFLTETVVAEFHQAIVNKVGPVLSNEMAVITIKIPESLASNRTLKDMERLAGKAFGEYYKSFINLRAVPGSIVITWLFPENLTDKLEQLALENKAVFKEEGVEEVTVAGRVVFPRMSEEELHMEKVQQALHALDERADQITAQGREMEQQIDTTTWQAINVLKESGNLLKQNVKAAVYQKLQVLSQQREVAKSNQVQQKIFEQEEEQQVYEQEEEDHTTELMKAASLLPPLEEADINFTINEKILSECSKLGEVNFSLSITSQVVTEGEGITATLTGRETSFELTTSSPAALPVLFPLNLLSCQLTAPNSSQPVECIISSIQPGSYTIHYTPAVRGPHQLRITLKDIDIPGSPFTVRVFPSFDRPLRTITGVGTPCSLAVSKNGEVAVCGYSSNCISVFNREGKKLRSFGSSGSGKGQFNSPSGIAFTHDDHLIVVDKGNHRLQMFTLNGEFMKSVGQKGSKHLQFNSPSGIAIDSSGRVFIADTDNHRIKVLKSNLSYSHMFGDQESGDEQFENPRSVAVSSQGDVYVIDNNNKCVQKFTSDGRFISSHNSELTLHAICIDSTGMVYVGSLKNDRCHVSVLDSKWQLVTSLGTLNMLSQGRTWLSTQHSCPLGMTVDKDDNLYVFYDRSVHIY